MAPLTPAGFLSDTQQVSLLHALNLPTIPSPTTPRRFDCLAWCHSRTYRHSDRSRLAAPVRQGIAGVSWASPWYGRLATTTGRIEFVILRTGLSPPDALHTPSRECSSDRLRGSSRTPTGTRTLLLQVTRNRTIPVARAPGFLGSGGPPCPRAQSPARSRPPSDRRFARGPSRSTRGKPRSNTAIKRSKPGDLAPCGVPSLPLRREKVAITICRYYGAKSGCPA